MLATTILLTLLGATPQSDLACNPTDAAEVCAPASPELRARVRGMLGAIDRPVPPEEWHRIGPDALPALTEIATSTTELPFYRARAVEALSILGGDGATATALRLASAPSEAWDVRASAVRGLGRLLPPERLVAELTPLLERDPHANVRDAAATVLTRKAGPRGCDAVRAQATRMGRPDRAPYARALARCR